MRCQACTSRDVLSVNLDLSSEPVSFHHCRGCETRWWTRDRGAHVALGDVLAAVGA